MTCGMPLEGDHANDIGLETVDGIVCRFDIQDGQIKSGEDIFEGGVQFFLTSVAGGDRDLAERLTRKNMGMLPYWQQHSFASLEGVQSTDQEFGEAMSRL